jgi:hypothetical protein
MFSTRGYYSVNDLGILRRREDSVGVSYRGGNNGVNESS